MPRTSPTPARRENCWATPQTCQQGATRTSNLMKNFSSQMPLKFRNVPCSKFCSRSSDNKYIRAAMCDKTKRAGSHSILSSSVGNTNARQQNSPIDRQTWAICFPEWHKSGPFHRSKQSENLHLYLFNINIFLSAYSISWLWLIFLFLLHFVTSITSVHVF